ncbi:MAG: chemotaxis protein CheW, partial [Proteobacteria bacterium]|nr:chemotaxis protein CheW [Pseudomonadota bacterium]MBU1571309.1 chemotaxis protein CheW [Pseudomonadota bacterium]
GLLLAVNTDVVGEIVWLPELTVLEEHPSSIAGAFNLRGKIVPVMDLTIRFGRPLMRYNLSDRVIILSIPEYELRGRKCGPRLLGIIVNRVNDVIEIPDEDIEHPQFSERDIEPNPFFIKGAAGFGDKIIMIVDPLKILDFDFTPDESAIAASENIPESSISYFCPEAVPEEKEIYHRRASELQQTPDLEDSATLKPVAVIGLNSEYLCVELKSVREFSKLINFISVPCCPEHIAGNMNLRGNVLTLVDIRNLLNMQSGELKETTKVIVADTGEILAGLVVDEIFDVVYLRPTDITPVPSVAGATVKKFIRGTAPYGNNMMSILDLEEILRWEGLVVNEEP